MVPWVFHSVLSGSLLLAFFSAAEVWQPRIHWSALTNGTVSVTISPKFSGAARYKICMENSSGCHGKVSEYEIWNNSIVYMVSNLDIYKSYQIWVRPENRDGVALDAWIFKNDLVTFTLPPPAAEVWRPCIHWSALSNGTVFVTINSKVSGQARYKICMENSSGCHGKVSEYEIRNDSVVYMVSNLDIYKSYQIWVRPENGDGVALDAWIFKNDLVTFTLPPPENASGFHVTLAVLTTLLSVLVLCVLIALFVVRKGYFQKVFPCLLWFNCYRQQGLGDDVLLANRKQGSGPGEEASQDG